LLALLAGGAHADTWVALKQEWLGQNGYHLGSSIAVVKGYDAQSNPIAARLLVGMPYASDGTFAECGAVQVYVPGAGGWVPETTLYSNARRAGAHFGASMAAYAPYVVVGAPDFGGYDGSTPGAGRAEIYQIYGTAGSPDIRFDVGINGSSGSNFGSAVAVNAGVAAVAAVNASAGKGCISTYRYDTGTGTWSNFPATGAAACGSSGAALGSSVGILRTGTDAFLMIAGAPGETQNGNLLAGGAHVFFPNPNQTTGGFLEVGTLAADTPTAFDFFGTSVGIDADYVYVGATGRDNGAGRVGSVTIFKPANILGYDYLSEYFPGAPATIGGHCGAALSVDAANSQFILGCPDSDDPYYTKAGTARVYRRFTFLGQPVWLESVLSYGTQPHNANFSLGRSVAIMGNQAFAGAPNAYVSGQSGNGAWKAFLPDQIFKDGFGP
jgi:hypothetical protein